MANREYAKTFNEAGYPVTVQEIADWLDSKAVPAVESMALDVLGPNQYQYFKTSARTWSTLGKLVDAIEYSDLDV
jgi:hypothetical protein